jgi:uncharacterized membrane protein
MRKAMQSDRWLTTALLTGGIFTSFIGIAHIFMPQQGYDSSIPLGMPPEIRDHFYYLATYAICAFLLTLGFISIYTSQIKYPRISFVICLALGVLWISRTVLEIKYPVHLHLFFLNNPSPVLLPVIAFIACTYSLGALSYVIRRNKKTAHANIIE